jgi:drug/metabolite transporter, DME family
LVSTSLTAIRIPLTGRCAGLIALMLAALLWSVGAVMVSNLFDQGVSPLELAELRTYITVVCFGALLLWPSISRSRPPAANTPGGWRWLVGFGLAVGVANASLFLAIEHLQVAVAIVLQNLAPTFVVVWTLITTRRVHAARLVLGVALALLGVVLVVQLPTTPVGDMDLVGVVFGLATALGAAAFSVFGEQASRAYGAVRANAAAFAVAGACWVLIQVPQGIPKLATRTELLGQVLVVGVLCTFVPFLLFAWGTARLGSQTGALTISLGLVFTAAIAWVWLGESLTVMQIVGVVAIILGIVRVQFRTEKAVSEFTGEISAAKNDGLAKNKVAASIQPDASLSSGDARKIAEE